MSKNTLVTLGNAGNSIDGQLASAPSKTTGHDTDSVASGPPDDSCEYFDPFFSLPCIHSSGGGRIHPPAAHGGRVPKNVSANHFQIFNSSY